MTETLIRTFGGNIGIGTTNPGSYKLYVNGDMTATSMRVGGADNTQVPIGLVWMWYGTVASIPSGWALCNGQTVVRTDDGQNIVTPNLVDYFIRGADGDAPSPAVPGQTGGVNSITLSTDNLPSHNHDITIDSVNAPHNHNVTSVNANHTHNTGTGNNHTHNTNGTNSRHTHSYNYRRNQNGMADDFVWAGDCKASESNENRNTGQANAPHAHGMQSSNGANHGHSMQANNVPHSHNVGTSPAEHGHTGSAGNAGQGQSIDIKNRYYVLAYIMKH